MPIMYQRGTASSCTCDMTLIILLIAAACHQTDSFSSLLQLPTNCSTLHLCPQRNNGHIMHMSTTSTATETASAVEFVGSDIGAELQKQQKDLPLPDNYHTQDNDVLASLFGSSEIRNDFFKDAFGRRAAYFPRQCQGGGNTEDSNANNIKYKHPPCLDPPISGIDLPSLYETNDWIALRKRGGRDMLVKEETSYTDLTEYISGGGSAIIPIISGDYLYETKVQIEHALGVEEDVGTSMNIYHSGPQAVALNIHYDAYPVFVLQLEGEKEWIIQNDNFGQAERDVTDWRNVTMTSGDMLYLPQGVYHAATGAAKGSTHATIGLL